MASFKVLDNGQVVQVLQDGDIVIESAYDMQYHIELHADKLQIEPDDSDSATITAVIVDYLGAGYTAYDGAITFALEGETFDRTAVGGAALIEVTADHAAPITVEAWIVNSRAGRVTIIAKASDT